MLLHKIDCITVTISKLCKINARACYNISKIYVAKLLFECFKFSMMVR